MMPPSRADCAPWSSETSLPHQLAFRQNCVAERLIGLIRRECLRHVIIRGEANLRRILRSYVMYYNKIRTHGPWTKMRRSGGIVQRTGVITSNPILGGFHHHYIQI